MHCRGQAVLPIGLSDGPQVETLKLYCPRCEDLYTPSRRHAELDGSFFTTSMAHLLLSGYPELIPPRPTDAFEKRIFGFKVHPSSPCNVHPPPKNGAVAMPLSLIHI